MEIYILLKNKEVKTLDQGILSVNNILKSCLMNRPIAFYKEHHILYNNEFLNYLGFKEQMLLICHILDNSF